MIGVTALNPHSLAYHYHNSATAGAPVPTAKKPKRLPRVVRQSSEDVFFRQRGEGLRRQATQTSDQVTANVEYKCIPTTTPKAQIIESWAALSTGVHNHVGNPLQPGFQDNSSLASSTIMAENLVPYDEYPRVPLNTNTDRLTPSSAERQDPWITSLDDDAELVDSKPTITQEFSTEEQKDAFINVLKRSGMEETDTVSYRVLREALKDKQAFIILTPANQEKSQRISMQQSLQPARKAAEEYDRTQCKIRTKTVAGTPVGDGLLVAGEFTRNPVRGFAEKFKEQLLPGQPLTEREATALEISNAFAYDLVLTVFTAGAYPIIKYGGAKALTAAGHAANQDATCLKNEFSSQEMANLLFDTEIGLTERRGIHQVFTSKPTELSGARAFHTSGVFVQEDLASGIHTEKYLSVKRDGVDILIREKSPGEYVTYHPGATDPERLEKVVSFDPETKRIHFGTDLPENHGYDFDVIDGRKYIRVHGDNYELNYDWVNNKPRIKVDKSSETKYLPVYTEKLSRTWHLTTENKNPVFSSHEKKFINQIKIDTNIKRDFHPVKNVDPRKYAHGQIYEVRPSNEPITNPTNKRVVEINGNLVPLRIIVVKGQGVQYEAFRKIKGKHYIRRIEWDGARWRFDRNSSPFISSELLGHIGQSVKHEKVAIADLDTTDIHGLRWSKKADKKAYIKINNRYVQVHHDGDKNTYHLESGDSILPLEFKKGQFHLFGATKRTPIQRILTAQPIEMSGDPRQASKHFKNLGASSSDASRTSGVAGSSRAAATAGAAGSTGKTRDNSRVVMLPYLDKKPDGTAWLVSMNAFSQKVGNTKIYFFKQLKALSQTLPSAKYRLELFDKSLTLMKTITDSAMTKLKSLPQNQHLAVELKKIVGFDVDINDAGVIRQHLNDLSLAVNNFKPDENIIFYTHINVDTPPFKHINSAALLRQKDTREMTKNIAISDEIFHNDVFYPTFVLMREISRSTGTRHNFYHSIKPDVITIDGKIAKPEDLSTEQAFTALINSNSLALKIKNNPQQKLSDYGLFPGSDYINSNNLNDLTYEKSIEKFNKDDNFRNLIFSNAESIAFIIFSLASNNRHHFKTQEIQTLLKRPESKITFSEMSSKQAPGEPSQTQVAHVGQRLHKTGIEELPNAPVEAGKHVKSTDKNPPQGATSHHGIETPHTYNFKSGGKIHKIKILDYSKLNSVNSVKKEIFDLSLENAENIVSAANKRIQAMSDNQIALDFETTFGAKIDAKEAAQIRKHITELNDTIKKYADNKSKFKFTSFQDSTTPDREINARYSPHDNTIIINDPFFKKSALHPFFTLIHELSHETRTVDNFYLNKQTKYKIDDKIVDIGLMEIDFQLDLFIGTHQERIQKKIKSLHTDGNYRDSMFPGSHYQPEQKSADAGPSTRVESIEQFKKDKNFERLLASNADSITLYTLYLYHSDTGNKKPLNDILDLIKDEKSKTPLFN